MNLKNSGLGLFRHLTFRQKKFWHENFIIRKFLIKNISTWVYLGTMAKGHFDTRIFWHMYILAHVHFGTLVHFSTDISEQVPLCRNFHVPKCSRAITFPCQNVHCAKEYPCQNVLVPKYPLPQKSRDEISVPK